MEGRTNLEPLRHVEVVEEDLPLLEELPLPGIVREFHLWPHEMHVTRLANHRIETCQVGLGHETPQQRDSATSFDAAYATYCSRLTLSLRVFPISGAISVTGICMSA